MYIFLKNAGLVLSLGMVVLFTPTTLAQENNQALLNSQMSSTLTVTSDKEAHAHDEAHALKESHEEEHKKNHAEKHDEAEHDIHEEEHNEADEEAHEKGALDKGIIFSAEKIALANIKIESIVPKVQYSTVYAPGEIKVNGYKSYIVSPRTESVITNRHAILGEHVQKDQKLVTLFSESMAQAQADYLIASTEWQRVKKLGNKTISESQLLKAEANFNASYGRLIALGLTDDAIQNISKMSISLFGQYTLTAKISGVVLHDDFYQGQRVAAGDSIMLLANEKDLWVEAKVAPNKKLNLSVNAPAIVSLEEQNYHAKVIQEAHTIDPITRTRIVRLSVDNQNDNLHSGMFVKVNFQFETDVKVMAVPEDALIRSADGDWVVFVEDHPGEFEAVEVELGRALGDYREVIGLNSGNRVVTQGAFFVASEIAKGGFDPHNH